MKGKREEYIFILLFGCQWKGEVGIKYNRTFKKQQFRFIPCFRLGVRFLISQLESQIYEIILILNLLSFLLYYFP